MVYANLVHFIFGGIVTCSAMIVKPSAVIPHVNEVVRNYARLASSEVEHNASLLDNILSLYVASVFRLGLRWRVTSLLNWLML